MSETAKMDHEMSEHRGIGITGESSPLSRQVTVALSPEQYERLFFQPSAPRRGDLAKRFGIRSRHFVANHQANNIVSQSYYPWLDRFSSSVYLHSSYTLRIPRCRRSPESSGVVRRLLFLWCYSHECRWNC
jgi:hypothetical protein